MTIESVLYFERKERKDIDCVSLPLKLGTKEEDEEESKERKSS